MCGKADGHMQLLMIETESNLDKLWDQEECNQVCSRVELWESGYEPTAAATHAGACSAFLLRRAAHPAHLDQRKLRRPLAEKLETEDNQLCTDSTERLGSRAPCNASG